MGFTYYKRIWAGILKLAGKNRQDTNCSVNSGKQQGEPMSDYNEEEGNTRLGRDTYKLEPQDKICGYKL